MAGDAANCTVRNRSAIRAAAMPSALPSTASITASISNCRTTCHKPAPSDARIAIFALPFHGAAQQKDLRHPRRRSAEPARQRSG